MYRIFTVTLLVAMLIPIDGDADPIAVRQDPAHEIKTADPSPISSGCKCCECEETVQVKRPVMKAVRSIRIRKFLAKLIGVQK